MPVLWLATLLLSAPSTHFDPSARDQSVLNSGWSVYEHGFSTQPGAGKTGGPAYYCENSDPGSGFGATNVLSLNQETATPFSISAWSRAEGVSGTPDDGYSLYLDLAYVDGSHLWGTVAPFDCGTHGWQERHVRIVPTKAVKGVSVFLLLRRHTGKAWFSDVVFSDGGGKGGFDFQPIEAPTVGGVNWFIRDVGKNSRILPASRAGEAGLRARPSKSQGLQTLEVTDITGSDRALTLYYCVPVDATGGTWGSSIRNAAPIKSAECANLANVSSGANGLSSLYPFATVTNRNLGRMLAVPPDLGPRVFRLFYNPASRLLCAAFDVALVHANRQHPASADAAVLVGNVDPGWGFRDAARQYYQAFPAAFKNRIAHQGIWIPFTDPSTIAHPEDFGISAHEGDNSIDADARIGVLSFRYTEPMTWWMNMAPALPRTYDEAMTVLRESLQSKDPSVRKQAQAVMTSGTFGADGRFNVSFANEPWANGAVWVLNPNPALPRRSGMALQADVVFDPSQAKARYATTKLSGEYLDSLEDHADVLDYRKESLAASSLPPSFDGDRRPVIPQGYSTYEIAHSMSEQLHAMGKLLMANTTPLRFPGFMPLMDCAGIEVNWLDGGAWSPDSDEVFCYRRTMADHKPYMLLQNTDFSKFGPHEVDLYFKKCLFYGVFPSFFSANSASNPYWENPNLYNRDRTAFKATIPLIQIIDKEGWEPVTHAWTSDSGVFIERYGDSTWTVYNNSSVPKTFAVSFDRSVAVSSAKDLASGESLTVTPSAGLTMTLQSGDCRVIRLGNP